MTAPAAPRRLPMLDTVRGVAVMGILLLNILSFALPQAAYSNPRAYGGWHGADLAVWAVSFVLVEGKMRGLFSFLFGASMLLVVERAETAGRSGAATHYSRMAWLLLFGLAHLWLVWEGDILAHYAMIGMIAFGMRRLPVSRLVVLGTLFALLGTVLFAAVAAPALQPPSPAHAEALRNLVNGFGVPPPAEIARELAEYRGDYAAILRQRFAETRFTPLFLLSLYGPETLAYMLFGMAALRSGMLTGRWEARRYRKWLLVSWGIAVPAYAALAMHMVAGGFSLAVVVQSTLVLATPFRPPMIAGWICLIALLARPGGRLTARIAAAGRMAFTNYLATSLICTSLFYGYGLGWYGHLSRWQLMPVVLAIWALMLLWSRPWLARFRYGPFEWLWRSLARGRLQPIRGSASV